MPFVNDLDHSHTPTPAARNQLAAVRRPEHNEDAQEKIGESGGPSLIQRGGQGRSPGQSLGGQAKRAHLRAALVRLQPSNNRKRAGRAKVDSSGRSSDNRRFS